ncbi:MAG: hypothetical protein ATN31_11445 [Candidatus Epulonipiscioides saccharophilum]|nr:MAG: hypothetical protein ATN31_11445 [Epulopiscium sp. AS2M-Bin001]
MIDFHVDTAMMIFKRKSLLLNNEGHVDLEKLQKGGYLAQWFAMFISLNHLEGISPFDFFEQMYDYFIEQVNMNSDKIEIVTDYNGYTAALTSKKIAAFLSLEEGEVIKDGLHMVDKLEDMKIRLMTLTWNHPNSLGAPHTMPSAGLTHYGQTVVDYLNNKKILLDVSHLSDAGIDDVINISKKPIIASHSNARAIWNHSRNLSDEHIRKIANSGGLIGINYYNGFLAQDPTSCIADIIKMAKYLIDIAGEDCVGFGSDFDGIDCRLEIKNASEIDALREALHLEFTSAQVDKMLFRNAERIIRFL